MNCIARTYLLIVVSLSTTLYAQTQVSVVARNKGVVNGYAHVEIKWFTPELTFGSAIHLYRRAQGETDWKLITDTPVKPQTSISSAHKKEDPELEYFERIAKNKSELSKNGFLKIVLWIKTFQSTPLCRYLGIYYLDTTAAPHTLYQYKAVKVYMDKVVLLGESNMVYTNDLPIPGAAPEGITVTTLKKKCGIRWQHDTKQFWGVNVYRKTREQPWKKLNEKPLIPNQDTAFTNRGYLFEDDSLAENTLYFYKLSAVDYFNYETLHSGEYPVYIADRTAPHVSPLRKDSVYKYHVYLGWDKTTETDLAGYHLYRASKSEGPYEKITTRILPPHTTSYRDSLSRFGDYYYFLTAIDTAGNETPSNKIIVNAEDVIPPATPTGLKAVADTGRIILSWNYNTEPDLWGYYIYRGAANTPLAKMALLRANPHTTNTFTDTINKAARNKFFYKIAAVDSSYNVSKPTDTVSVFMPDIIPPEKPYIKNVFVREGHLYISWLPNKESDLAGYNLYLKLNDNPSFSQVNKTLIPPKTTQYNFEATEGKNNYTLYITAVDSANNTSLPSDKYIHYAEDHTIHPYTKGELQLQAKKDKKTKHATLQWKYTGKMPVKGYVVYIRKPDGEYKPISAILKNNTYKDKPTQKGEITYQVRVYFEDGTNVRSEEKKINIK